MELSPEEFVKRLQAISENNGIPYGRTRLITDEEQKYNSIILQYKGHFALSYAFKCFFLETVELINTHCRPKITAPVSEFYGHFVPRMTHAFHSLCGTERTAVCGYPFLAYTVLRNVYDNLVLSSASLQKFTDFYNVEGVEPGKPLDIAAIKKLRKKTEYDVRLKMTGKQSNLTRVTRDALEKWDLLFDWEVHGARLSMIGSLEWIKGTGPLPVVPRFIEREFGMFMNRYSEVGWMTHRLIPNLQLPGIPLSDAWKEKWRVLDDSFELVSRALTEEGGKAIGAAIVELVNTKFPFNEHSTFPL
ncbi:MAG: hypothetical protein ABIU05_16090 [Nitrospirales bacterium]